MIILPVPYFILDWFSALPVQAQAPRKVKMTIPVVAHSMTPVYLAQSKGFFADEKLEVDITSTGGGGPDIRALIAGDVDFSFTTGDNVILAHQEGKKLLMVDERPEQSCLSTGRCIKSRPSPKASPKPCRWRKKSKRSKG